MLTKFWNSIFLILLASTPIMAADEPLSTIAERSGFQKTGRYDEVIDLCPKFQAACPKAVLAKEFGRTPEGRPMMALVVSRTGCLTADEAHKRGLPVMLIQGGIHAGEIDGKDAGFLALREALNDQTAKGALDKLVLIFVPVFNIDGHERFGRWNRPNQRGPEEMGWRTTAQNLNLNRDYVKADAPGNAGDVAAGERVGSAGIHRFARDRWREIRARYFHPSQTGTCGRCRTGPCRLAVAKRGDCRLNGQGSLPTAFYPSFAQRDDPSSGFVDRVSPPRFSHGYFQLRNRFGMLVETHSWKDYPTRVRITHNTIVSLLEQIAAHGKEWLKTAHEADARSAALAGQWVPLDYETSPKARTIEFRGYEYTPHDVGRFRCADDALRREQAAGLESAAARRNWTGKKRGRPAGGIFGAGGVRPDGGRQAQDARCAIPRIEIAVNECRGRDVSCHRNHICPTIGRRSSSADNQWILETGNPRLC